MIEFIIGASGSGKSTLMIEKIGRASDSGRDICVIVPEQFSYEFDKKLYKAVGAKRFNGIMSQSFSGIARHLFQTYGDSRRTGEYADETARMILVYQALRNVLKDPLSNRCFEKQASRQGFSEEVLKLIGDLKRSGISPQQLMDNAVFLDKRLMDKTCDIALIYIEFDRLMNEYGYKDFFDDIREASAIASIHTYFSGKDVYIDEFESFTGDQLDFLHVIAATADNVYISLRTDDVTKGEYTLFETVNATYNRLARMFADIGKEYRVSVCDGLHRFASLDLAFLSANIMRGEKPNPSDAPVPDRITVFEARDPYGEADYVCAQIKHLLFEDSTLRCSDIAILSNKIEQYSDVLSAALERYGIPYFFSLERSVMHNSLMIYVTTLLDIAVSRKYRTEQIFRHIKCGMLGISVYEASMLENYCYKWGVDGEVWREPFTAEDKELVRLEELRKLVIEPLDELRRKLRRKNTAQNGCEFIYRHMIKCGADRSVSEIMNSFGERNEDYYASEMKRIWNCLMEIFDSVSETFGDEILTVSELSGIIRALISRITYSVPPQTLDSVTVASARTARLNSPRVVFVMGSNDGDFPNTVNTHGIFSETDKQKLSEHGIEIARRLPELIASERLIVYKAFSIASERLFISYVLSDLSGQSKYSSPVIESIYEMFGTKKMRLTEDDLTPDFYAVTMRSAFYRYMQERRRGDKYIASIERVLSEDDEYRGRIAFVKRRSESKLDFRVTKSTIEQLKCFDPFIVSQTSFEKYNQCHFKYFCSECLDLFTREKIDLDARNAGTLIHNCFRRIMGTRTKEEFLELGIDTIAAEIREAADECINVDMGGDFSKTPRFDLACSKLRERLLKVFTHTQNELRASEFVPAKFELNLRDGDDRHTLRLRFADGKTLSFGGVIDRADICRIGSDRYVRIIDYKSSGKKIDPYYLTAGVNMQMLLYLFTITEDKGIFSGYKPAGVLYSPIRINKIGSADERFDDEDTGTINSNLKASGLVLSSRDVLEAMEHDVENVYVPASFNNDGSLSAASSCLSVKGFEELREFTYRKLIDMAEGVYSGNAEACPVIAGKFDDPCMNCDFINICGDAKRIRSITKDDMDVSEAAEILSKKKGESTENGEQN